jgi:alpha-mannosidase
MHDDSGFVLPRVARFVRERLTPALHRAKTACEVTAWTAPGEPVPFAEAAAQEYRPFAVGEAWGRPWGTVWFRVTGAVPAGWAHPELVVDLGFTGAGPGFQAEGTVYAPDGVILGGLEPRRRAVPMGGAGGLQQGHLAATGSQQGPPAAAPARSATVDLYVEAAANPDMTGGWAWAPTALGDLATAGDDPLYRLGAVELAELDVDVWTLVQDIWTLTGLVEALPGDLPRRAEVLRALERAVDAVDPEAVAATAAAGRAELAEVLGRPAYASAHRVYAVGHAHIDSAWLWPVRETVRKVTRTFANALQLMDRDEEFVFAASSAQQYAWVRDHQPELFARVRKRAAEGRFVPVGGMWVESDTNMPGGEALARQLVYGAAFFRDELGVESDGVWLPDSFGYSAALPQIAAAAGRRWLLTQKISWNDTNRFPHHTFAWEGIDGTRILTHFPPVDTYNAELSGGELARAQRQFAEKGRANTSLVPFGWGDGGGGPTREMLAAAQRTSDLEGSPAVRVARPTEFFAAAAAEYPTPPVWVGELYLEYHRGTYTTQARTKRGNRRSEHLLREAELWATAAAEQAAADYPVETLRRCWETVLLQQFHDILPGTSIAWVHRQAEREYARVADELETVIADALTLLVGPGDRELAANAGPYAVDGVPGLGVATAGAPPGRVVSGNEGYSPCFRARELATDEVRIVVDERGLITSIYDKVADRELIPAGRAANLLQLHRDTPTWWDAWDIDRHYRRHAVDLVEGDVTTDSDGGTDGVRIVRHVGGSTIAQTVVLRDRTIEIDTHVEWHERQKLLKLAFPLDVHADRAASEIQFGHVHRPTHANTSWDAARFETCAHRWVHVGEPGYGVAVANDATYGHDITRDGPTTTVRLSLVRAPLSRGGMCRVWSRIPLRATTGAIATNIATARSCWSCSKARRVSSRRDSI